MCPSMPYLKSNAKKINETSLFVWRIIDTAVDDLDNWSRWQIYRYHVAYRCALL